MASVLGPLAVVFCGQVLWVQSGSDALSDLEVAGGAADRGKYATSFEALRGAHPTTSRELRMPRI